jgi:hypothetical protein
MTPETLYGVWIPGEGWLRGKDVFADPSLDKAQQVARLVGRGARVYFIDESIRDLEQRYLEQEKRTLWHTFNNWFRNRTAKSSSRA